MEVDWLQLPEDITNNIVKQLLLGEVADIVRFGAVCKPWKHIADKIGKKTIYTPWLMLPQVGNSDYRKCFSLSNREVFNLYLPECRDKRCPGSPLGWVLTIGLDRSIQLLNPLTRRQVSLPSLPFFEYPYFPNKPEDVFTMLVCQFALESSTTPCSMDNCVVMVMYHEHRFLALASSGDKAWTEVDTFGFAYDDTIFFNGRWFLMNRLGLLSICDMNLPRPKPMGVPQMDKPGDLATKYNLVEMCGDLHLVVRMFGDDHNAPKGIIRYLAKHFKVFKLDFDSKKWIELADLGDHALFVGTNASFSVSTSDYKNLKPNCIYFTDDDDDGYPIGDGGGRDMGIYDFAKETVEHFYMGCDIISSFSPPLFFMPCLE